MKMEKLSKCVTDKNFIIIGKIGKPHGIKGDIRVYPLTDFPDRFAKLTTAYIDELPVKIESVQHHNGVLIMHIQNFDSREKSAALTGKFLQVPREEAAPLSAGEYYTFDIIGLAVYDEKNTKLGTVTNVLKTGSNDVYVVEKPEDGGTILLPALKKVVTKIDIKNKRMDVIWTDEQ